MKTPNTLLEATRLFKDPDKAHEYLRDLRWPDGVIPCPDCGGTGHYYLATQRRWKCKACKRQFSVKVGTIFEDSPLGLDKWLIAVWLIVNAKNGISSYEIHRALGVTQKTAWFMLHRIRLALQEGTFEKFNGEVEADETYIGGRAINMHRGPKRQKHSIGGGAGKALVIGFLERGGKVRAKHIGAHDRPYIENVVRSNVEEGAKLYTDSHGSYRFMSQWYLHEFVDHAVRYAEGVVHTNCLENYWSLLKRSIRGTYVSVEPFHLFRYLDEQAFRYNERKGTDGQRFDLAASSTAGKRLTYRELTGKALQG